MDLHDPCTWYISVISGNQRQRENQVEEQTKGWKCAFQTICVSENFYSHTNTSATLSYVKSYYSLFLSECVRIVIGNFGKYKPMLVVSIRALKQQQQQKAHNISKNTWFRSIHKLKVFFLPKLHKRKLTFLCVKKRTIFAKHEHHQPIKTYIIPKLSERMSERRVKEECEKKLFFSFFPKTRLLWNAKKSTYVQ